jgi:hypothetical protein
MNIDPIVGALKEYLFRKRLLLLLIIVSGKDDGSFGQISWLAKLL